MDTMTEAQLERYGVDRQFHLSVMGRTLNSGDLIELNRQQAVLRINRGQAGNGLPIAAVEESIRVITELAKKGDGEFMTRLADKDESVSPHTQTITAFPVVGCLKAAEEWLGKELNWNTINDEQEEFFELFYESGMAAIPALGDELKRKADSSIDPINKFLKENGFDIQLTIPPGQGGFSVASILNVLVEWLKKGSRRKITNEKGTFDGVHLKQNDGVAILQNANVHPHPVARIATKSGDKVYMTPVDGLPEGRFALESKIRSILVGLEHPDYRYEGVVFPMVNYNREIDISFMQGLNTGSYHMVQAMQQTKFRMNETGAHVESAAVMTMSRCLSPKSSPFVIDRPFLLWITRDGINMPLFGGLFAEDVWSDPKTLD
jgi:hypothetical protein